MKRIVLVLGSKTAGRRRRGMAGQHARRESERMARRSTIAIVRWLLIRGSTESLSARRIGLPRSTLARWETDWREDRLAPEPAGRPADRPDQAVRNSVLHVFSLIGVKGTERKIAEMFPTVARSELRELAARWRKMERRRHGYVVSSLRWRKPGRVWAQDFTYAPTPIDGRYLYVLAVRDLASNAQVLALPTTDMTAKTVIAALRALFTEHGAPLVMKSDNGSGFVAEETKAFLEEERVVPLLSPPGYPEYNGSCEAGIGGLKTRAHHIAVRFDRPGEWTSDDVEGARILGNETGTVRGMIGTPAEVFAERRAITEEERECFLGVVEEGRIRERAAMGLLLPYAVSEGDRAAIDRSAIADALVESGLLLIRRRRISQPVSHRKCLNVS